MRFHWGTPDPVERVFGIVIAVAFFVMMALALLGPDKILGMSKIMLVLVLFFGIFGLFLGLRVVRWFRKRDE